MNALFRGKLMSLITHIRREDRSKSIIISFYLRKLKKEGKISLMWKEMNIRSETNEGEKWNVNRDNNIKKAGSLKRPIKLTNSELRNEERRRHNL